MRDVYDPYVLLCFICYSTLVRQHICIGANCMASHMRTDTFCIRTKLRQSPVICGGEAISPSLRSATCMVLHEKTYTFCIRTKLR